MRNDFKRHLLDRLYGEYQAFKTRMLSLPANELFGRSYEIDIMVNLYEIMIQKSEGLTAEMLSALLDYENLLGYLYDRWLKVDDNKYSELEKYVEDKVEALAASQGKEQVTE